MLKLATLARVRLSEDEAEHLSHEFEGILRYVGEVKSVAVTQAAPTPSDYPVRNVMRDDTPRHEAGVHTEALLAAAPAREGNYVKVKKIL